LKSINFIFDLDGTLVDSKQVIYDAINSVREKYNLEKMLMAKFEPVFGMSLEDILETLTPGFQFNQQMAIEIRFTILEHGKKGSVLYPGVVDLLKFLKLRDFGLSIATNKPQKIAQVVVANSSLAEFFTVVVGTGQLKPKPSGEIIHKCKGEIPALKYVVVGDQLVDFHAGKIAGCATIGIGEVFMGKSDLQNSYGHRNYKSLDELAFGIREYLNE
jgi:HAD superfamily hydrolase (TIGR01549 family)